MDSFVVPVETTYMMLARQGYAAQSRRQGGIRHSVSPTSESFNMPSSSSAAHPIDMPSQNPRSTIELGRPSTSMSSYTSSSVGSASPTSSYSPLSRNFLNERYSSPMWPLPMPIDEDDEDGVVIHSGIKRMSLNEQSRPRLVKLQ
ncbi:hypothetical protein GGI07_001631 [Coemansia sp. Benny D115]|nr:hypothetical protein GGI07_001631 [Coemansia sp. Benny D115]